jgi:hypothetical protein
MIADPCQVNVANVPLVNDAVSPLPWAKSPRSMVSPAPKPPIAAAKPVPRVRERQPLSRRH